MIQSINLLFQRCEEHNRLMRALTSMQNSARIRLRANLRELRELKRIEKELNKRAFDK